MIYKLRHILVFIFVLSVFSLTLQASITGLCKGNKALKSQTNSTTEEEKEESSDNDESIDEIFYLGHNDSDIRLVSVNKLFWSNSESNYLSFSKSIPIPPPKF